MKISDLPKFTNVNWSYRCNYGFESLTRWICSNLNEWCLELNPDFQRGHIWTEQQQIAYIEFVLKGGQTGLTFYFNHPNYRCGRCKKGEFVCVDGLQRMTSIQRFVNNEIKAFGKHKNEFEDWKIFNRRFMEFEIIVNELQTRKEVLQWYIEFNSGGTDHTEDEISRVKKLLEEERNNVEEHS